MDDKKVQSFWRIFKYVWPQWPRLILVVIAAILVAILFTLSFMTIGPLLKVMMDEEGMHGWIDRKTCDWVYGIDFYVPDRTDFHYGDDDISYYLRVTNVEENSIAERLGFKVDDQIIGAGKSMVANDVSRISSAKLLEELAKYEVKHVVCEPSGGYEQLLRTTLETAEYQVWLVDAVRIHAFIRSEGIRVKTDKYDAKSAKAPDIWGGM